MKEKPPLSWPLRSISAILAAAILFTSGPLPLMAKTTQTPSAPHPTSPANKDSKIIHPRAKTESQKKKTRRANRTIPKVPPPRPELTLSQDPSDEEITTARVFAEPVISNNRKNKKQTSPENRALAGAMRAFAKRTRSDDFSALEGFLAQNPQSPRRISLLVNLGIAYYKAGYFSKALQTWEEAWEKGKGETDPQIYALANRALGELALLAARMGRAKRVEELLTESRSRTIHGPTSKHLTSAAERLDQITHHPENALRCGPIAIQNIFETGKPRFDQRIKSARGSKEGTNLTQMCKLANTVNLQYQMAKRTPGAELIVPSIMHLKLGHFSALTKKVDTYYLIRDPSFGDDLLITQEAIEAESSSYFLIPAGQLPPGWQAVSEQEGQRIWGKCTSEGEPDEEEPKKCTASCGMARSDMLLNTCSLRISDTPLFYNPARGPSVQFELTYIHRDPRVDTILEYSNFGPKWTFDWLSYAIDNPAAVGVAAVKIYQRGGGFETHSGASNGVYAPGPYSQSTLVVTSTNPICYEKRYNDGSKEIYDISDGTTSVGRKVFLSKIIDPAGNTLTLNYDSQYRIIAIIDSLGQVTTLFYTDQDPCKITKIEDPFGRSAHFEYNEEGNLTAITDMIGIQSIFQYGSGIKADFITHLTTPYGTTTFDYDDASTTGSGNSRFLITTDPYGSKERVETSYYGPSPSDAVNDVIPQHLIPNPAQIGVCAAYQNERNTFFWGKKAMDEMGDGPLDYSKAHVYHWVHSANKYSTTTSILESEKEPGTNNRIWYRYPGQSPSFNQGTSDQPTKIARVIGDLSTGGTTQLIQRAYNDIGNKTEEIDPAGRITRWKYDATGMDLQGIYQVVNNQEQKLVGYSNYTNHQPGTITDASGQATTYTYTSAGQVATITRTRNGQPETTTYSYITDENDPGYGNIGSITDPIGGVTTYTYDDFGRLQITTQPNGYWISYTYDALNRITKIEYPDGTNEQTIYNRLDPEWTSDRLGRWTQRIHNATQQVTDIYDPAGRHTQYEYCPCGALEGIIDPNGNHTTFILDTQSRVVNKIYNDNKGITYTYEPTINRLQTVTDAMGQTANYEYNIDNTLKQLSYSDLAPGTAPTPTVSYTYDPAFQRITSMTDGIGTTTYQYYPITTSTTSRAGKLQSITSPILTSTGVAHNTITFDYDEYGRVVTQGINNTNATVSYDALGRVTQETNALCTGTSAFTYTYDDTVTHRLSQIKYPNGQVEERAYHGITNDFHLSKIQNRASAAGLIISQLDYTYTPIGNILTWKQANSSQPDPHQYTFTYDPADQLTGATLANLTTGAIINQYGYAYDATGNRLSEHTSAGIQGAKYNGLNQLTELTSGSGIITLSGTVNKPATITIGGSSVPLAGNKFSVIVSLPAGPPMERTYYRGGVGCSPPSWDPPLKKIEFSLYLCYTRYTCNTRWEGA